MHVPHFLLETFSCLMTSSTSRGVAAISENLRLQLLFLDLPNVALSALLRATCSNLEQAVAALTEDGEAKSDSELDTVSECDSRLVW